MNRIPQRARSRSALNTLCFAATCAAAALAASPAIAQSQPSAGAVPAAAVEADVRMLSELVEGRPNEVAHEQGREYRVRLSASLIFPFDNDGLTAQMMAQIEDAVHLMTQPEMALWRAELVGYTDEIGDTEYNAALSMRRAEAAKRYMVARGIAPERIDVIAGGERLSEPAYRPAIGQALSRRVDLLVTASASNMASK